MAWRWPATPPDRPRCRTPRARQRHRAPASAASPTGRPSASRSRIRAVHALRKMLGVVPVVEFVLEAGGRLHGDEQQRFSIRHRSTPRLPLAVCARQCPRNAAASSFGALHRHQVPAVDQRKLGAAQPRRHRPHLVRWTHQIVAAGQHQTGRRDLPQRRLHVGSGERRGGIGVAYRVMARKRAR